MNFDKFMNELQENFLDHFEKDITDTKTIKKFLEFFIDGHNDFLAVDFLDSSNWDTILRYSYDPDTGELEAVWHDFCDLDPKDEAAAISRDVFGVDIEKLFLKLETIKIGVYKEKYPYLLLKGYYQDTKEINKRWNTNCSSFSKYKINLFSEEIVRVVKNKIQRIFIPTVNVYSTAIVPKMEVDNYITREIIFLENRRFALENIKNQIIRVKQDYLSRDEVFDAANSARRYFEHFLKIFSLEIDHEFLLDNGEFKDYQKLMLGDLVAPLKERLNKDELSMLDVTVKILNKYSHDHGQEISKDEVSEAVKYAYEVAKTPA